MQLPLPARVRAFDGLQRWSLAVATLFASAHFTSLFAQIPIGPYAPPWADAQPTEVLQYWYDPASNQYENGDMLKETIRALQPGQKLEIGGGTYSIESLFNISLQGTPDHPIWITARGGDAQVVITRSNAAQNVINIGQVEGASEYIVLQGLEIVGGSIGLRVYEGRQLWLDQLHIHNTGDAALSANRHDNDHLYITRNHIHDTHGYGEGMYLGGNFASAVLSHSIIALNYVHHTTGGWQGDGIELKQGSYGNWIAQNVIHDTNYPCLLVYGTGGNEPNRVERNILYRSNDNVLQVAGEAYVSNNLIMDGNIGFQSHDHQTQTRDLVFVHNTVINRGLAANLHSWAGRPGMVFANNAIYSRDDEAIRLPGGQSGSGITIRGNVVYGEMDDVTSGFTVGNGLPDFEDLSWDATHRLAVPDPGGALMGAVHSLHRITHDLNGSPREVASDQAVGAYAPGSYGTYYGRGLPNYRLERPVPVANRLPVAGDQHFAIRAVGGNPHSMASLLIGYESAEEEMYYGGTRLSSAGRILHAMTNANGVAEIQVPLVPSNAVPGTKLYFQWVVDDPLTPWGATLSEGFEVTVDQP
ncbi:MAG: right-handed parallel beta-helix repeat-containing protein [bacterium]|nr:right-handed parallel beta-helix repeat-containing protein [bacterium]